MSDLDDFKATYFDECSELLGELEEQFAAIEAGERDSERLNAVFRAIHSIKGGAGAFGFSSLVGFAHEFETLLDYVRNGKIELTDEVVALCIRSNDIVADFVAAARSGEALGPDYGSEEKARFVALSKGDTAGADDEGGEPMEEFDIEFTPVTGRSRAHARGGRGGRRRLVPALHAACRTLCPRQRSAAAVARTGRNGRRSKSRRSVSDLPSLGSSSRSGSIARGMCASVSETLTEDKIREVFEFVEGDCDIESSSGIPFQVERRRGGFEDDGPSLADLVAEIKPETLAAPASRGAQRRRAGGGSRRAPCRIQREQRSRERRIPSGRRAVDPRRSRQGRPRRQHGQRTGHHPVHADPADGREPAGRSYQELVRGLEILAQTTRGLQDSVMAIRAQPVKSVFSRMPRLVRELATKTDKKIRLETVGENTEIDKTVIEQLSDPLDPHDPQFGRPRHRNAGKAPRRRQAGSRHHPAVGRAVRRQYPDHRRGRWGRHQSRTGGRRSPAQRGVIGEDQQLTEEQIDNLIFAPGFSTVDRSLRHLRTRRRHGRGALQHQEDRRLGARALVDRQGHAHDAALAADPGRARRHAGGGGDVPLCHSAVLDR